jgi:hypothetical protein
MGPKSNEGAHEWGGPLPHVRSTAKLLWPRYKGVTKGGQYHPMLPLNELPLSTRKNPPHRPSVKNSVEVSTAQKPSNEWPKTA